MNLKVLLILVLYYSIIGMFFSFGGSYLTGFSTNADLNTTFNGSEVSDSGITSFFTTIGRFFAFIGFGIGLPSDTPSWFSVIFFIWQTCLTVFTIGFIISSIHNG